MEQEISLHDIADNLLILNKITIDTLFKLDNCVDCIALYVFYYKTAKWQKTDTIKASDAYIRKSLKWGNSKILSTKKILKENGLIEIVQRRKKGKISGWYVRVSYLVAQRKIEEVKIQVDDKSNNYSEQELLTARSGCEETNALKENIKCLKIEIEMLKNKISEYESKPDVSNYKNDYKKIIDRLNELAGTSYRASAKTTKDLINARIKEGFTEEDILLVIEKMCYLWNKEPKNNEKDMRPYLRPSTLFRASNFENYLNMNVQERKLTTRDIQDKIDLSDF